MWGHFYLLHPAARQQHHFQVEQIGCQVACGLSNVKAHSGEDRTWIWKEICAATLDYKEMKLCKEEPVH